MKISKYPDKSSYVTVTEGTVNNIIFRINSYEDLWQLNQFVDAYNNKYEEKPTITIPNLIDAQADRRFNTGESSGLKLVCEFLNGMNAKFRIFHPHNPEVVEALMDNVYIIDNRKFTTNVLLQIHSYIENKKKNSPTEKYIMGDIYNHLTLMSSDAGGFKPLINLCEQLNWKGETYSASKARTKEGMKQLIDRQDFGGKDVMIVDDICVYGGTFKGLSKLLRERNVGKLYLAVSHMTVQNLGEDPVTEYFDKVFTTNSKFDKYYGNIENGFDTPLVELENLKIIKLF